MNPETDSDEISDLLAKSKLINITPAIKTMTFKIKLTRPRLRTGKAVDMTRANPDKPPAAISLLNKKK